MPHVGNTPIATIALGYDITKLMQAEINLKVKNDKIEKQNEEKEKRAEEVTVRSPTCYYCVLFTGWLLIYSNLSTK